ncbi:hypothetical protein K9L67_04010 [Candidatus Woesearchaeota archaeon]|nr:hypothetical protein [Candidatus Woesearchaeota archaeon]MCF7901366.1 hypothetical protein [Candidatus Woesearchaeota archaeon]MCF8013366.1 hypothetical protein [Candidatus Woesearchaeota archaeon]
MEKNYVSQTKEDAFKNLVDVDKENSHLKKIGVYEAKMLHLVQKYELNQENNLITDSFNDLRKLFVKNKDYKIKSLENFCAELNNFCEDLSFWKNQENNLIDYSAGELVINSFIDYFAENVNKNSLVKKRIKNVIIDNDNLNKLYCAVTKEKYSSNL